MCVGEVLLKQWKQGNTFFVKPEKTSNNRGLFFDKLITFIDLPVSFQVVPTNTKLC